MTTILSTIDIPRPVETVFDYVTTPGNWPEWHPSSERVVGATDHSLGVGEQVTEDYLVAGRSGTVTWTVRERVAPTRWVIDGVITTGRGGGGTITYTCVPRDGGTRFVREFVYALPSLFYAMLDVLIVRRRIAAESDQALRQLRDALVRSPAPSAGEGPG